MDMLPFIAGFIGAALVAETATNERGITGAFYDMVDGMTGYERMQNVPRNLLSNPQIRAFLQVIRKGEGTADIDGYRRHFGGELFQSFDDHPRKLVIKNGYKSTAAGAYQALVKTWDETAKAMGLTDFMPSSQDLFALGRLAYRGAIQDILDGNFYGAVRKANREWASLPESPYGQPTISMAAAKATFQRFGGVIGESYA